MGKSYKIVINSKNGENQLSGTDVNDVLNTLSNSVYFPLVHWDRMLPEGKFKLTWTYTASGNVLKASNIAKIKLLGFRNDNTFETTSNNGSASILDLGILKVRGNTLENDNNTNTNVCYLDANLDDNKPIYLERRPNNGPLTIQILKPDNSLWYDDTGRKTGAGVISKGNPAFTTLGIRDIPTNVRLFIGCKIIRESNQAIFSKITDYETGFGAPSSGGTVFNYSCPANSGFATGGITNGINPSNPPAHYILQLNFELL